MDTWIPDKHKLILNLVKKIKKINFHFFVKPNSFLIIDFYNIYCCIVKYNKHRLFSKESWELTIDIILKSTKAKHIFIISKPIFEVTDLHIQKMVSLYHGRFNYIIVDDLHFPRGLNKERDDYTCILLHYLFNKMGCSPMIVTNDMYSNYSSIISDVKDFKLRVFNKKEGLGSKVTEIPMVLKSRLNVKIKSCLLNYQNDISKTLFYF